MVRQKNLYLINSQIYASKLILDLDINQYKSLILKIKSNLIQSKLL